MFGLYLSKAYNDCIKCFFLCRIIIQVIEICFSLNWGRSVENEWVGLLCNGFKLLVATLAIEASDLDVISHVLAPPPIHVSPKLDYGNVLNNIFFSPYYFL